MSLVQEWILDLFRIDDEKSIWIRHHKIPIRQSICSAFFDRREKWKR